MVLGYLTCVQLIGLRHTQIAIIITALCSDNDKGLTINSDIKYYIIYIVHLLVHVLSIYLSIYILLNIVLATEL